MITMWVPLQTRNPMLLLRLSGSLLLRLAARQFLGLLFQDPPRSTRDTFQAAPQAETCRPIMSGRAGKRKKSPRRSAALSVQSGSDAVISSAVLHFARDEQHFNGMLDEMWRVLKPGGLFFARLTSSIGIEKLIKPLVGRRYLLPDGSECFLVDEELLTSTTEKLCGEWLEPLKTTNVQNLRCMTTWVLRKAEVAS